jgi:hypothetical protein
VGAEGGGGLDLDAEEAASVVEDEVVALAVAPGFGDAESEGTGFVEESGFVAFAAAFGVFAAGAGGLGAAGRGWRAGIFPFHVLIVIVKIAAPFRRTKRENARRD